MTRYIDLYNKEWVGKSKGDRKLKGSGKFVVQWAEYQIGKRGDKIVSRKEKAFRTITPANAFIKEKSKSKKFIHGAVLVK